MNDARPNEDGEKGMFGQDKDKVGDSQESALPPFFVPLSLQIRISTLIQSEKRKRKHPPSFLPYVTYGPWLSYRFQRLRV